jgi:hypothetical protein
VRQEKRDNDRGGKKKKEADIWTKYKKQIKQIPVSVILLTINMATG